MKKSGYVNSAGTVGYRYKLKLWKRFPSGVVESPFANTEKSGLQRTLGNVA